MSENFIKKIFFDKFKIQCKKIEENKGQNGETPDFLLFKNNLKFAVCEVKKITDDNKCEPYEKISAPAITKIAHKIKKASEQMKQYTLPKVLVFVDYNTDFVESLKLVISEHSRASEIDLYIWINKGSVNKVDDLSFGYRNDNEKGKKLMKYFNKI